MSPRILVNVSSDQMLPFQELLAPYLLGQCHTVQGLENSALTLVYARSCPIFSVGSPDRSYSLLLTSSLLDYTRYQFVKQFSTSESIVATLDT